MNPIPKPLRRRVQLLILLGICVWSIVAIVTDIQFRQAEAVRLQQQKWIPPSTVTLGSRHMTELRDLAAMVEAHVPEGSIIGTQGRPKDRLRHHRQLAICLGYLMPRHHVKELRQRPRVEEYWLTIGHHLKRKDLELVEKRPGGALYKVPRR